MLAEAGSRANDATSSRKRIASEMAIDGCIENDIVCSGGLHELDDKGLLAAARCGRTWAFGELCRPHARKVFAIAYRITKNREDAEDALQDSYLRAFVHIGEFD